MTNFLIIDDEPIAHRVIEKYCNNFPSLNKVGNCYNAFEAMELLNSETVDLIFLDINMPKLSGFELLKTLAKPPKVIVTTAYKEFAIEGYELNVTDYLLKPFSLERFIQAINKTLITKPKKTDPVHLPEQSNNSFFIKGDKKHHQVDPENILFVEASGNKSKLFLKNEIIICHEKISDFENLLSSENFLRVHKSFIVALKNIKLIEGNQIIIDKHNIPIGQTYRKGVNKLLGL